MSHGVRPPALKQSVFETGGIQIWCCHFDYHLRTSCQPFRRALGSSPPRYGCCPFPIHKRHHSRLPFGVSNLAVTRVVESRTILLDIDGTTVGAFMQRMTNCTISEFNRLPLIRNRTSPKTIGSSHAVFVATMFAADNERKTKLLSGNRQFRSVSSFRSKHILLSDVIAPVEASRLEGRFLVRPRLGSALHLRTLGLSTFFAFITITLTVPSRSQVAAKTWECMRRSQQNREADRQNLHRVG